MASLLTLDYEAGWTGQCHCFQSHIVGYSPNSRTPVAMDVNVERAEDVLTHKRLLDLSRDPANRPAFEVRLVQIKSHKDLLHFETAYVVKFHRVARLAQTQPVFTFIHPEYSNKKNNQRYKKLCFDIPKDTGSALVHGLEALE